MLCYFLSIKRSLSTTFHLQIDGQTKRQNYIIKVYFQSFVNFEENKLAKLLPMAGFAFNSAKNASINHMLFELNCGYYPHISFEEDINPWSQLKTANKLLTKLQELMTFCQKNLYYDQKF